VVKKQNVTKKSTSPRENSDSIKKNDNDNSSSPSQAPNTNSKKPIKAKKVVKKAKKKNVSSDNNSNISEEDDSLLYLNNRPSIAENNNMIGTIATDKFIVNKKQLTFGRTETEDLIENKIFNLPGKGVVKVHSAIRCLLYQGVSNLINHKLFLIINFNLI
jgi:hypothetical protein